MIQAQVNSPQKMVVSQAFNDNDRLLRRPEVEHKTGLTRSAIYDAIRKGVFPEPIPISNHSVAWLCSEVDEWISKRVAMRVSKYPVQCMKA